MVWKGKRTEFFFLLFQPASGGGQKVNDQLRHVPETVTNAYYANMSINPLSRENDSFKTGRHKTDHKMYPFYEAHNKTEN